jgi:glycerophosphoryl diester phosphodiesterase
MSQPMLIGHRCAAAIAPENTLAACQKAIESGVAWVEFDVVLAACGTPVVFHDHFLSRATDGHGRIKRWTYEELQQLDAGSWFGDAFVGERIPSLLSMLQACDRGGLGFNLEVKPSRGQEAETARVAWQMVQDYWPDNRPKPFFSSFSDLSLQALRACDSDCQLGYLMPRWRVRGMTEAQSLGCKTIHVKHTQLSHERVQALIAKGFQVLAYTLQDAARVHQLLDWGVSGFFVDNPNLLG